MEPDNVIIHVVCVKCGARMPRDMECCPVCGKRQTPAKRAPISWRKYILFGLIAVLALGLIAWGVVAMVNYGGSGSTVVTLDSTFLTLEEEAFAQLSYTITPERAENAPTVWSSSDDSVATVDDTGYVEARGEGECVITLTVRGVTAQCHVTVAAAGVDLAEVYDLWCQSYFADVASDGSYLTLDTNPYNIEDHLDYTAYFAVSDVNTALGLPDSLLRKMDTTRALDGRLTEEYDHITVSWTYHPDDGLEILYELP